MALQRLADRQDGEQSVGEMDEPVIMIARQAERLADARAGQRARDLVVGHGRVSVAAADRVQREEEDEAGERRVRERPAPQRERRGQQDEKGRQMVEPGRLRERLVDLAHEQQRAQRGEHRPLRARQAQAAPSPFRRSQRQTSPSSGSIASPAWLKPLRRSARVDAFSSGKVWAITIGTPASKAIRVSVAGHCGRMAAPFEGGEGHVGDLDLADLVRRGLERAQADRRPRLRRRDRSPMARAAGRASAGRKSGRAARGPLPSRRRSRAPAPRPAPRDRRRRRSA